MDRARGPDRAAVTADTGGRLEQQASSVKQRRLSQPRSSRPASRGRRPPDYKPSSDLISPPLADLTARAALGGGR
jgi:hypothetical protein